ncbi:unnamed protein product [Acanthoscelides obtectus]|uniref:Glomulin n=1 Tax=Acanthoscelides obtectus TaxID=200917 RepID=A0A9P0M1S5_ACAOB|nr:unnamed protein product [Acanthoscelides obtectus]CAK1647782.1 Glomulin [Acanthoscelides obtectus]
MAAEPSDFVTSVRQLLNHGDIDRVLTVFSDEKNKTEIVDVSWELLPILTQYLTSDYGKNSEKLFKGCEELLQVVADTANPEETVLQFIEELEESTDDIQFLTLLKSIPKVLCRISQKRTNSVGWCYNSIHSYLQQCEVPECCGLVGREKLLLDSDEKVQRILFLYSEILQIYDEFFERITPSTTEESNEHDYITKKFLVDLLGMPLVYLDVEIFNNVKSKARLIAENIVGKIFNIIYDPMTLTVRKCVDTIDDPVDANVEAVASLFYLIFSEEVYLQQVPKVYDPDFFFYNTLHLSVALLEFDHQIVVEKGIKFSISLLQHIEHRETPYTLLDSQYPKRFLLALSNIIVYNKLDILRIAALDIYKKFITSFDPKGKYLVIYNLVDHLNHSGLKGFTITLYKEELAVQLRLNNNMSCYFQNKYLFSILSKVCYLHKKEESDLVEISDQIIAALNLLRYLLLADKENTSLYMCYIDDIKLMFLDPLRKGIDLSRAHYQLKVKEIQEDMVTSDKSKPSSDINIMVGGKNLGLMPKTEKLDVLNMSMTVFDVMDSLLSRVEEIIENKRRDKITNC